MEPENVLSSQEEVNHWTLHRDRKIQFTPSSSSSVILIRIFLPVYSYAPEINTFPAAAILLVYVLPKTRLTNLAHLILNVLQYVISGLQLFVNVAIVPTTVRLACRPWGYYQSQEIETSSIIRFIPCFMKIYQLVLNLKGRHVKTGWRYHFSLFL